jgi:hypothetical protein
MGSPNLNQRFEGAVAFALTVVISLIILVALYRCAPKSRPHSVLIALLAVARKFIVLDMHETSPGYLLAHPELTSRGIIAVWRPRW